MQTLQNLYREMQSRLKEGNINNPDLVARVFLKEALKISDAELITEPERTISGDELQKIEKLVQRRLAGEPVSRILGEREFWGLPFKITADVLDPRPDTETIIEAALESFGKKGPETILDLGTGSGCILIALLHEWPQAHGIGVDISERALEIAGENAKRNGVEDRIEFIQGDWCENIGQKFDLIVSNPPYIPNCDIESLMPEVKNHDPILALDGGNDGLDCYKKIISRLKSFLKPDGICLLEIGIGQSEDIMRIVEESGFSVKRIRADLSGIPRVVEISCGDK